MVLETAQEAHPWQEESRTPSPLLYCPCSLISKLAIASPLALPHQMCFEQGWQVRALQFPWSWHSMERIPPEGPDAQGGPGHLWDSWWGAVASQPGPLLIPEAAKISRDIPRALWKQWGVEGQWPCSAPGQPCQTEQREKGDSKIIPSAGFKFQSCLEGCGAAGQ